MAPPKTVPTGASVAAFLGAIADADRRRDCRTVQALMRAATNTKPKMWGPGIVGFGTYRYHYQSGREANWFLTGFSPRKQDLTLYIMTGLKRYQTLMRRLGKHRTGRSCLCIKRLEDIDVRVLTRLINESVRQLAKSQA